MWHSRMTRIVGDRNRFEIVLDPVEAWHRGRVLDAMLAKASPTHPRGVFRGTRSYFDEIDLQRRIEAARLLNPN